MEGRQGAHPSLDTPQGLRDGTRCTAQGMSEHYTTGESRPNSCGLNG